MLEPMMIVSLYESITSWFTPTILFFLTNFIIATIFIASNKHHDSTSPSPSPTPTPLARVSSFIERAKSINHNLYHYTTSEPSHHYPPHSKTANHTSSYIIPKPPPQHPPQPKTANYTSTSRLAQSIYSPPNYITPPESLDSVEPSPSQLVRVDSVKIASSPSQLARAPSFLDRVMSFKISSVLKSEPDPDQDSVPVHNPNDHVNRSKSEKRSEMKKWRSEVNLAGKEEEEEEEVRRPATARECRDECDEEVDAKADDFISRFKQQLKLQRLESLVRYNEMLNRRR